MTDADLARTCIACLDLTALGNEDMASIDALCAAAITPAGPVAAVCTWPKWVAHARERLGDALPLATVVNFPAGSATPDSVRDDCAAALDAGATEIDVVAPWRALLAGDETRYATVLDAARSGSGAFPLKVIIESGELPSAEAVARAARLALAHGADFVKTSTGKTPTSATPSAAATILEAVVEAGGTAGFKASGGVRTLDDARVYAALVERHLGAVALQPNRFRIGASSLLSALLAELGAPI